MNAVEAELADSDRGPREQPHLRAVPTEAELHVRERLVDRRRRLATLAGERREQRLVELLRRVDGALAAIDVGEWGVCTVCHEHLNEESLRGDPLVTVCLECLSIEERRALERDLQAAARVQRSLLPAPMAPHDGWDLAFHWEPRGAVSGDYVDLVRPASSGEPSSLLLGDVMGKGVAASLLQSHLHALFRALAGPALPLGELLGRVNRLFWEATNGSSYATLIAMRLHPDGRVEMANAGHPRPLLADRRGVRPVEGSGLPLGLFAAAGYDSRELRLAAGETLLLYTDGWTEATAGELGADEEYGIGRAAAALRRASRSSPTELIAACREDLTEFLGAAPSQDDVTLLAVRRGQG
jgi:sigma-B regulation protein RsbU (phosphoserine phosphatase)